MQTKMYLCYVQRKMWSIPPEKLFKSKTINPLCIMHHLNPKNDIFLFAVYITVFLQSIVIIFNWMFYRHLVLRDIIRKLLKCSVSWSAFKILTTLKIIV